ncbi:MAG: hypothetical protein V5A36_05835 [Natronomonas sp.]
MRRRTFLVGAGGTLTALSGCTGNGDGNGTGNGNGNGKTTSTTNEQADTNANY